VAFAVAPSVTIKPLSNLSGWQRLEVYSREREFLSSDLSLHTLVSRAVHSGHFNRDCFTSGQVALAEVSPFRTVLSGSDEIVKHSLSLLRERGLTRKMHYATLARDYNDARVKIKKAVITAAGRNQNRLPLQTLVDRDGHPKSALQIILEEAVSSGIDEVCVVICPGDRDAYLGAAGAWAKRLRFVEQSAPLGYGQALYCANGFVADEPFLHLVSDHLYLSNDLSRCSQQLVEVATSEGCSVSAVQATRESLLPFYGAIGGKGIPNRPHLYQIEKTLEKPTPTEAEQQLLVPGLRAGHYLCFFGMHVLTPRIMEILAEILDQAGPGTPTHLSAALLKLADRERCLAFEISGRRFNIGVKFGLLNAQLALALAGQDREEVLAQLLELLAQRQLA
jgi:UTP--glucose-1-phosphate uridylyltransferase